MPVSTRSSSAADRHLWITILAGGIGSRFWPASTPSRPKQLLPLGGERPLIADTLERARALAGDDRLRVLARADLMEALRGALPRLPAPTWMIEPRPRGTGPALAWAAATLHHEDPDAVLVSLHSDHVIRPLERFVEVVRTAADVARREKVLVTLGVPPTRPETGFGYIQPGEALDASGAGGAHRVAAFHEKPDRDTAERYGASGYLWNTGIFVWPAGVFLDEVRRHADEIAPHLGLLEVGNVTGFFEAVEPVSVDVAVLERSDRVAVVEATFAWDDVGTWDALARTHAPDEDGNVRVGGGSVVGGHGNIVYTDDAPVVLWGVDDLVVVRTGRMTLVTRRETVADLKDLLAGLPPRLRDFES